MKSSDFSKKDISQITTYHSGVAQATAHRLVNRMVSDFLLAYGLTPMQWFAIGFIYDAGQSGIRLSDLAKRIDTTLPYITTKIALLESKGIVEKLPHVGDNRIKLVRITSHFMPTVSDIEQGLRERMREELYTDDRITREELSAYIHVLYKIISR